VRSRLLSIPIVKQLLTATLTTLVLHAAASSAEGQNRLPLTVAVAAGVSVDIEDGKDIPNVAALLAARATVGIWPFLLIEPSVTYAAATASTVTSLLPECGVHIVAPRGSVRPYVGAGIGRELVLNARGVASDRWTRHVAAGIRVSSGRQWEIGVDLRVRGAPSVHPQSMDKTWFDLTLSVGRRLSPP
jgi:hypothetical protein